MSGEISEIIDSLNSIAIKRNENPADIDIVINGLGYGEVRYSTYDYDNGLQQHTLFEFDNVDDFDNKINEIIYE